MTQIPEVAYTHAGKFHADDVFSAALLRILRPDIRFVRAMGEDTLDREMFLDYIVQDSIYLRDYLKVFAYAITKSDTLRDMQLYYQLLGYVNDGENVTRLNYLKDLGITDAQVDQMAKRGPCADYCRFLVETAARAGLDKNKLGEEWPRKGEIPFDSAMSLRS